ncbi:MAG: glycine--tRNA ligase subunit beta [Gammaproteobacteria bacterium 39-13]|nr:glycine--tRNA ligase subunit beta [Gammaproteobacteria bacterium]OJV90720.1 MAG: glycine--tRNA ligase subunit beta [Gammaproteobacteria bacterium 39-13]
MAVNDTLLIEIGTEELPPSHLGRLSNAFVKQICQAFNLLGISYGKTEHFVTPRRIAARIYDVPSEQPTRIIQKRGPALASAYDAKGQPTPAALGFARGCGVSIEQLQTQESAQGAWLVFEQEESGKKLIELLPSIVEQALNEIPATKRMRWGDSKVEFLRPLHWIMALHGSTTLPIQVFGLTASNRTRGHRFHFPEAITLSHANHYVEALKAVKVMADQQEREKVIQEAINALARENQGQAIIEESLLDQVSGLVEWPVPLYAHFNKAFLEVPQEALISSMQNHQKCFAINDNEGKLLPTFILISNTEAKPADNIVKGNERVMHARLSDAKFFYDQDRKTPLVSRLEGLKNMIFQKRLGTLYDKSQRIAKLAGLIGKQMGIPSQLCERAGKLCKADLLTEMVFEFPELQGIMGNYYALNDGENKEVALAIKESYLPRFAKDVLPQSPIGICIALADRLDTLIGIFGIGQIPSGDKDPFGLRRQALGILRILIENQLTLDLEELCHIARHGYGNLIDAEVIPQVVTFCFERFKAWYQEQNVSIQVLEAVMANRLTQPYDCSRRVLAVNYFQTLPEAQNLSAANKRVRNILQKGGIMLNMQKLPEIEASLLKEKAEKDLSDAISTLKIQATPLIQNGKYQEALVLLAQLQKPVDTFFDEVMVMTDDQELKKNRINLLSHLSALFMQIADISKLAL